MGQALMGGTTRGEDINLLNDQQMGFLNSILSGATPGAAQAIQGLINPETQGPQSEQFQKSVIDPALLYFNKEVSPAIKQQFLGGEEFDSSALNQALGQAATDLSTSMGSQYSNHLQQQKMNQLQGLNLAGGLSGQRTFEPFMQQQQGLAGPLISAAGTIGGAYAGGPFGAAAGASLADIIKQAMAGK